MIDLDRILKNESGSMTVCRLGISERITERGYLKLFPFEVSDVRLRRFSITNEQDESFLPISASLPSLMEFKCGRFDIIIDKELANALSPNSIKFKCGRSFTTNEEYKKFRESYPISPILIVDNLGRFLNSNIPEQSQKLYIPISIDSNSTQFNIRNDRLGLFVINKFHITLLK